MKTQITEEMGVHKQWKEMAEAVDTPEKLGEFVKALLERYEHDYGTIIHAIEAAMIAAFNAINKSPEGGITGFQASFLGWAMARKFLSLGKMGNRMWNYEHLLYPQFEKDFTSIPQKIWDAIQKKAQENIENKVDAAPRVIAHWQTVARGVIPFGLKIDSEDND